MKIVVTGATGHLGVYVVDELARRGHDVVAMSRSGARPLPPFAATVGQGSVRGVTLEVDVDEAVEIVARELGPDVALVHLAAWHPPATARTTAEDRARLLQTNVYGTMRVLEAARRSRAGCSSVVYASTFEVYGEPEGPGEVTEQTRVTPITDYGATKLSGEDHLLAFAFEEKTRVVALRMPAIYGPGETTSRALPNFLRAVARGERPTIFGDGEDLRDQLHGRDAALAVLRALESGASGIFNIADGEAHSILELARTAMKLGGLAGEPERRPAEKKRIDFHMSIEAARRELGFSPAIALEDGMREELAWLRSVG